MERREPAPTDSAEALLTRLRQRIAEQRRMDADGDTAMPAPSADSVAEYVERAAQVADVGASVPAFAELGALRRALAQLSGRAILYFLRLLSVDQRRFNRLLVRAVGALGRDATAARDQLAEFASHQAEQAAGLFALDARVQSAEADWSALAERLGAIDASRGAVATLQTVEAALPARDRWFAELGNRLSALDARVQSAEANWSALAERLGAVDASRAALTTSLQTVETGLAERDRWFADIGNRDSARARAIADLRAAVAYLRAQIADRDRRIDALLAEVSGQRTPTASDPAPAPLPPPADTNALDTWAFAQAFHGDEVSVKTHQARYLRYFTGASDVLDVGCGRGEFLELLRDAGITARGVDLSNDMVLRCREKDLDVLKADLLPYLAALPDASLGGVFASQVIEHLPTPVLLAFVRLAYDKLRPDGILVVETLNPECLLVHYRWFWMDLTHVRLIHSETLKFLLVTTGFRDLEGQLIGPREPAPLLPPLQLAGDTAALEQFNAATDHLNRLLHGSPDYALIARR